MDSSMSTALVPIDRCFADGEQHALAGFLAGYRGPTRAAYALDLRQFAVWCTNHQRRLFEVHRVDIECFGRELEARGRARETARRYIEASFTHDDLETCAQLIADGYSFTDHTKSSVAESTEALLEAMQDDINAWSDKELAIDRMMETSDGTVITQFRLTETHSGTYKSVPATGARVTFSTCNILTFGDDGKIIAEEAYYDDLQTMLKLGAVRHTGGG
jgi:steroid delta-isomerase-like uncharacterized protein